MLIVQVQRSEVMVQRWCRGVEVQKCREGPEQVQKCIGVEVQRCWRCIYSDAEVPKR